MPRKPPRKPPEPEDAFFESARRELFPRLRDSAIYIGITPEEPDPKYCLELGMAILLDKPIILLLPEGRTLARDSHLWRVADEVLEDIDFSDPAIDRDRVLDTIGRVLVERGLY